MLPRTARCLTLHHRHASPGSTLPRFTSRAPGGDIRWGMHGAADSAINARMIIHLSSMRISRYGRCPTLRAVSDASLRSDGRRGRCARRRSRRMHRDRAAAEDRALAHRLARNAAPAAVLAHGDQGHAVAPTLLAPANPANPKVSPERGHFSRAARPPTNGAREVPGDSITIAAAHARTRFDAHALSKRSRPSRVASALQAGAPCGAHVGTGAAGGSRCEHLFSS